MSLTLRTDIDVKDVVAGFEKIADADAQITNALKSIGNVLVANTQDRFDAGVSPDEERWIPSQRAISQGGKTLKKTGDLVQDLSAFVLDDAQITIGTNLPYAAVHQFGGKAGRNKAVNILQREYLGINDDDMRDIGDVINTFTNWMIKQ